MEDFEKEFYKHLMGNLEEPMLSQMAMTSATAPTTITKEDWLALVYEFNKNCPKFLSGVLITTYDIFPTNKDMYQFETSDGETYMGMHSDAWNRLLEIPGIVKEYCEYPTIYGVPVLMNDKKLIEAWLEIVEKNHNKRTISS